MSVRIVTKVKIGKGYLSDFADTEQDVPVIATTSQMLSTGVDLPTVRNIVLFRPIGSLALFKQIIGRGTRLFPDEDKLSFDIIDYAGATRLFADPEFDGPPERVDREEVDDERGRLRGDGGRGAGVPVRARRHRQPDDRSGRPRCGAAGASSTWTTSRSG